MVKLTITYKRGKRRIDALKEISVEINGEDVGTIPNGGSEWFTLQDFSNDVLIRSAHYLLFLRVEVDSYTHLTISDNPDPTMPPACDEVGSSGSSSVKVVWTVSSRDPSWYELDGMSFDYQYTQDEGR